MLLATQKKPELQLSAEEFRALGRHSWNVRHNSVRIKPGNGKVCLQPISRIPFSRTTNRVETILVRAQLLASRTSPGVSSWRILPNGDIALPVGVQSVACYRLAPIVRETVETRDDSVYSFKVEDESGKKTKTRTESLSAKALRWQAYLESREYSYRRLIRRRAAEHLARATIQPSKWLAATVRERRVMLCGAVRALPVDASIPGLSFSLESAKNDEFRRNPKEKAGQWPLWLKEDVSALRARMRAKDSATDVECRIVSALVCRGETVESARGFVLSLRNGRSVADAATYHLETVPKRTAQSLLLRFRDI